MDMFYFNIAFRMKNLSPVHKLTINCKNINRFCRLSNFYVFNCRQFSKSEVRYRTIYEKDMKNPFRPQGFAIDTPIKEHIKRGRKMFIEECKLFSEEVKEKFRNDPKIYGDGDTDVFFRFDNPECLKHWKTGSDKLNGTGSSECEFVINDKGKGVFSGVIDTASPKDGKYRFSGYCGIKSHKKKKSFFRADHYGWGQFTHLELKVKGDGRNYMVNLGLGMYYDVNWFDTFSYIMHTRGGPYWQTIRIPFSKFFLTSKGRIQDVQDAVPLDRVDSIGITAAAVSGPFHLEIDYIGCHLDESHTELTAYEMYDIPKEFVTD